MPDLTPPDLHHLNAVQGWLELGSPAEALRELDLLSREGQWHPDVLELRWVILARVKKWEEAVEAAERLVAIASDRPSGWIHRSFSLHELKRTQEAWEGLLPLAARFPQEGIIPYNLACYACQLGRLDDARHWLGVAMNLGERKHLRALAAKDPDLQPLWGEIGHE